MCWLGVFKRTAVVGGELVASGGVTLNLGAGPGRKTTSGPGFAGADHPPANTLRDRRIQQVH